MVAQNHAVAVVLRLQGHDHDCAESVSSQADGLGERSGCQLRPRDTQREADVVLDAAAGAGLPAGSGALYQQGADAFAGGVDGGGQTCWPGPNDDQVVGGQLRRGGFTQGDGDLQRRRLHEDLPVTGEQHG